MPSSVENRNMNIPGETSVAALVSLVFAWSTSSRGVLGLLGPSLHLRHLLSFLVILRPILLSFQPRYKTVHSRHDQYLFPAHERKTISDFTRVR